MMTEINCLLKQQHGKQAYYLQYKLTRQALDNHCVPLLSTKSLLIM